MIWKVLKIIFSPATIVITIGLGAFLGVIGLVTYWYYWTFKENELWKVTQSK